MAIPMEKHPPPDLLSVAERAHRIILEPAESYIYLPSRPYELCCICLEDSCSLTTLVPCTHTFCTVCITTWLSRPDAITGACRGCPYCRTTMIEDLVLTAEGLQGAVYLQRQLALRIIHLVPPEQISAPPPRPVKLTGRLTGREQAVYMVLLQRFINAPRKNFTPEVQAVNDFMFYGKALPKATRKEIREVMVEEGAEKRKTRRIKNMKSLMLAVIVGRRRMREMWRLSASETRARGRAADRPTDA